MRRDEDGSVAIAMTVVVIATVAAMALLSTVMQGLNAARIDETRANALAQADAGVDAALYAIDRQDWSDVTWVVNPTHFTMSVNNGGTRFDVDATQSSSTAWKVSSTGTDPSGKRRQTIATVSLPPLFYDALFSAANATVTGTPPAIVAATIGTNGTLSVPVGASSWWSGFELYGKADQTSANAACTNCGGAPYVVPQIRALTTTPPSPPVTVNACPVNGTFTGTVQPGDYLCAQNVTLTGPITVGNAGNGTGKVRIWVTAGSLTATGTINNNGAASTFQVFENAASGGGTYAGGTICGATIYGVLYAPGLSVSGCGSRPTIHGAVLVGLWNASVASFYYDATAASISRDGTWTVTNWHECPVGASDC